MTPDTPPPPPEPPLLVGPRETLAIKQWARAYGELCMRLAREKALEDAARVCDQEDERFFAVRSQQWYGAQKCAAAIRAMKQESRDE